MLTVSHGELLIVCLLLIGIFASRQTGALPGRTIRVLDVMLVAAVLALTMRVARVHGTLRVVHGVIAAVSVVIVAMGVSASSAPLQRVAEGLSAYVLAASFVFVLWAVLRQQHVTGDTLFGALAAYLAIAVLFGMIYTAIARSDPGAFEPAQPVVDGQTDLYYLSFVTITSLGFGDISPVSDLTRIIVPVEAVVGAILISALVGRIVGLLVAQASGAETTQRLDEIMEAIEGLDRPDPKEGS